MCDARLLQRPVPKGKTETLWIHEVDSEFGNDLPQTPVAIGKSLILAQRRQKQRDDVHASRLVPVEQTVNVAVAAASPNVGAPDYNLVRILVECPEFAENPASRICARRVQDFVDLLPQPRPVRGQFIQVMQKFIMQENAIQRVCLLLRAAPTRDDVRPDQLP